MVYLIPTVNKVVAEQKGVVAEVREEARGVSNRAKALLNAHRAEGEARITLSHHGQDSVVSLVDKAALSIEYGRSEYTRSDGMTVGAMEGLYIMHQAAGL